MIQPKDIAGYYSHKVKYLEDKTEYIEFIKKYWLPIHQREIANWILEKYKLESNIKCSKMDMKEYRNIDLEDLCKEAFKPSRVRYIIENYKDFEY